MPSHIKGHSIWPFANTEDCIPRHASWKANSFFFLFFFTQCLNFSGRCVPQKNIFLFSFWQQIRSCLHNSDVIVHNKELSHYSLPNSHLHWAQIVTTVNFFCDRQSWTHSLDLHIPNTSHVGDAEMQTQRKTKIQTPEVDSAAALWTECNLGLSFD